MYAELCTCVQRPEDSLQDLVIAFYQGGHGDWTLVVRLDSKHQDEPSGLSLTSPAHSKQTLGIYHENGLISYTEVLLITAITETT